MKHVAESVRARLLNLSRESKVSFNSLLEQYATGRFGKSWNTVVFVRTWRHLWLVHVFPCRSMWVLEMPLRQKPWNLNGRAY